MGAINQPPLIVHIIYRLGMGGLENGLINLINHIPAGRYRHAIVCLKDATDFSNRLIREDVEIFTLGMKEGHDFAVFLKLFRLLRKIKPDIVHTRNLTAIECQLPTFLAGVSHRVHGEHGWDIFDPDGTNKKYQLLRRIFRPLVHQYVPLSRHLEYYLSERIGVSERKITRICNGVDTKIFFPPANGRDLIKGCPFANRNYVLIGTVGRMHGVKDQINLLKAFLILVRQFPEMQEKVRLVLIGEGPLRSSAAELAKASGFQDLIWIPGTRDDVANLMRGLDIFVLPSQAEGVSNTLLEAMATGLPVIATNVGGNPELVVEGETGLLVAPKNPHEMANAIRHYVTNKQFVRTDGQAGLKRVKECFSLDRMVDQYLRVYDELMN